MVEWLLKMFCTGKIRGVGRAKSREAVVVA